MSTPRPDTPEPITVVDLFSGCGGFTQGFHEFRPAHAGDVEPVFHSVAAVEHNTAAAATYAVNFGKLRLDQKLPPAQVHVGDIEVWQPTPEALGAEVVVGGPPCQGFSALNRAKKGSERNRLWEDYVRIVAEVRPKVFVIENVDRFVRSDEFKSLLREVELGGKLADYRLVDPPGHQPADSAETKAKRYLLNSADYGARQARRRAIVIGVRKDADTGRTMSYPERTHVRRPKHPAPDAAASLLDGIETSVTYWNTVDEVFAESAPRELRGTELPDGKELVPEINAMAPGIFTTEDLHFRRNPELLSQARYRAIPPGGNRKDLRGKYFVLDHSGNIRILTEEEAAAHEDPVYLSTKSWDSHNSGTGDVMGRLRRGHPSVTIRTEFYKPEKGRYLHPEENRPITHFEAARIQGFPVDFRWCGTKTEIATQIGNAVPIPLGKAIASAIYTFLRG
ncbi:DNA cytosine methyltransferase [Streptomyces griseoincarnatus]|uniref:DNA cytosine methyltransferase n=1 Tax=Streptomyces sp. I4(2020) TaxID=2760981 RepID=UPI0018EE8CFF|nr:DNA cytosine methyltransferase [Streptomyces sp. I4(2020)]MBJ6616427.1 DNA cytosine methyltransferase [Streptomyces sp. I3(2020)]MBJ6627105.1 DNA cytosine methyltransferase [Streptomyces sp. I4(2020)]